MGGAGELPHLPARSLVKASLSRALGRRTSTKPIIKSYMTILTKNRSSGCSGWTVPEILTVIFWSPNAG